MLDLRLAVFNGSMPKAERKSCIKNAVIPTCREQKIMYLLRNEETIGHHASITIPSVTIVVTTVNVVSTRPAILVACSFIVGSLIPGSMRGGATVGTRGVVPIDPIAIGVSIIPVCCVSVDCADLRGCIRHKGRGIDIRHKGPCSYV